MNGRVYDYNLGKFMSVDPFIVTPTNSQSFNPYSYIMNNPLSGTDPSGYSNQSVEVEPEPPQISETKVEADLEEIKVYQKTKVNRHGGRVKSNVLKEVGSIYVASGATQVQQSTQTETQDIGQSTTAASNVEATPPSMWESVKSSASKNVDLQVEAQGAFGSGGKIAGEINIEGDKSIVIASAKGYGVDISARIAGAPISSGEPIQGAYTAVTVSYGFPVSFSFTVTVDQNKNWELSTAVGTGASLFVGTELGYKYNDD